MRYKLEEFKKLIPELTWSVGELAEKLSAAGFEAEVEAGETVNVTLTSNRKDCQDLKYLAFDLAGVYNLKTAENLLSFQLGRPIAVGADDVNKLLGSDIDHDDMKKLERLGFAVTVTTARPPNFRDVATVADVAEEIVRIIGYDNLNIKPLRPLPSPPSAEFEHLQAVKVALTTVGLTETASSSFSSHGHVKLKNPFAEDEPFLRESLQDGLLKTLGRNPYLKRAAFFEIGSVFTPNEEVVLGLVIAGYKKPEELFEKIEQAIGTQVTLQAVEDTKAQKFDAKQGRVMWQQLPLSELKPTKTSIPALVTAPLPKFKPISKYPPLVRDVTIPKTSHRLVESFNVLAKNLLLAELVDEYQDNQTYRLIFQKMNGSFDEADIHSIDALIQKHFFAS